VRVRFRLTSPRGASNVCAFMAAEKRAAAQRNAILASFATLTLVAVLWVANRYGVLSLSPQVLTASRWLFIACLAAYGFFRRSLTPWILISMIIGAEIGHDWPAAGPALRVLGQVFLRMIKTIIAPLLFATLVVGIASHADLKKIGRMGIKAIIYFELVTTVALFIGLAAINLSKAGVGVTLPATQTQEQLAITRQSASEVILHVFPENFAKSVAEGQVLQVVVFSIFFGMGLALLSEAKRRPMLTFCESLAEVMFKFTNIVMLFAPVGVGAAIAYVVSQSGLDILVNLAKLLATLYVSLLIFLGGVLLPVMWMAKIPVRKFIRAVAEPASIAFATTSSEAALPRAMEVMEKFGVPRPIVAFVMPTGYSFNLDGTTLYLSLAAIFVAQAAGIHLSFGRQLVLMLTLMLTSKGVAGVSRAAIVILLATVSSFGLPTEPVFILLGVDQLMDMARTTVNVIGNCLATAVIARWEGEFPDKEASAAS